MRRGPCLLWAAATASLTLAWWTLTVRHNFQGHWSALYCTGEQFTAPAELASENIYRFAGSAGYDGQFYHYIAHDPLLRRGFQKHVDAPRLRWRRILVPGLAHLLAAGQDGWIDGAYLAVVLGFVFAGAYWLSRWSAAQLRQPAWGMAFALAPGVLISIDRLTVDVALAALCVGFILYAREGASWRLYAVLALAGLVRETGLLLVGACCAAAAAHWRWRRAAVMATAALPALAWYAYVQLHTPGWAGALLGWVPLSGFAEGVRHRSPYPLAAPLAWLAHGLDYVALAGTVVAFLLAWRAVRERPRGAVELAAALFTLLAIFLAGDAVWESVYGFGRVLTPLLLAVALREGAGKLRVALLPLAMVTPRVVLQLGPQALGIARGLLAW